MELKILLFIIISILTRNTKSSQICLEIKSDLCISYSFPVEVGTYVQLKSRYAANNKNSTYKTDWNLVPTPHQIINNFTYFLDKRLYGWAGLSGTSNGLVMNGTRIQLKNTTNCLTAITCVKGSNSWCDSTVTQQVLKESDAQSGSYLMFKDCYGTTAVSQQFLIDPPCAVNCTKDMQNNKVCDAACNTTYCYWDNGYCNNTQTPTLSPTRKNTIGTLAPSSSSDSPTAAPKVNPPIPSSHPTSFIRNPTTYQSTTQPTSSTSVAEGPYFVATYVLLSLCLLFLFLFLLFAYLYWQSKKTAAAHVD